MVVIKKDIVYDETNDLKTDIYFPNNTTSQTKILIFWHGGGWFHGSKDDVKDLGVRLANAGFMTLIPDYRLAPKYTFPAAHNDSKNFVEWLLNSQYTDHDDLQNIVQIGASVGGTLALYIAGSYGFPTVTWSAPVDFSKWMQNHQDTKPSTDAAKDFGLTDPTLIKESFYKYFTQTYAGNDSNLSKMDATSYNYDKLSHLFMINSAKELNPLKSVLNYVDFLASENHEVQLLVIKGTGHAMAYAKDYVDESLDYLYQTIKGAKE
ncbi:alpha/beta hydrolase fold domain-containing protein [Lactobacillus hominis]|uniref:Putative esterase n=1 Tax=Lactobacillus hominis DSM 23910 = CRBIP 24.179 TaxID=1423758 RepID=I7KGS4_9LACO|nr:alpha/beta hydrolase [Lactobacillus hominis]KRM84722.1 esterase [Lactobacillus hominis DSM 23910 = CRBIP 24.179]MCT3348258.1 alpha/beta hydrolase [Lactobacillus hominis]CCI81490.1 Putative esterase [Lactobacillus hominis DSM 23910 = CRBIP 24.179]